MTLEELHRLVVRFYKEMEGLHPEPRYIESPYNAFCCVAEAIKALIRPRNGKPMPVSESPQAQKALTNCAIQLMTATRKNVAIEDAPQISMFSAGWEISSLCEMVGSIVQNPHDQYRIDYALASINSVVDLSTTIPEELNHNRWLCGKETEPG